MVMVELVPPMRGTTRRGVMMAGTENTYARWKPALSADQVVDLTDTFAILTQLRLLDATWTAEARAASGEQGPDRALRVSTLGGGVDALDKRLTSLADLAERLEPIFAQHDDGMRRE